jgi:membrane associated rhomboid family serine protease
MQSERTFLDDLKHQYRFGGMTIRLLFINSGIFILIQLFQVFGRLIGGDATKNISKVAETIFALNTDILLFLQHPWGLFTSIFAHFTFWHFLMNMLFLYFSGKMFESLFDQKRLLYTYLIGGIAGGLLEILAHLVFPVLQKESIVIVGASGSIMAIFSALAFHRPNLKVNLFGVFPVRLIFVAGFFILTDLFSLGLDDGTAHFAHIGGVIIGLLSVQNLSSSSNFINKTQLIGDKLILFISGLFRSDKKLKIKKGGKTRSTQFKTDEEYNLEAKTRQKKTDLILDKISKSGYESLTKAEKDFLFNQSKNG